MLALLAAVWASSDVLAQAPAKSDAAPAGPRRSEEDLSKRILEELSEEERQRFRAAVNKVWHSEEVEKRRQAMQEANLAYRKALQDEVENLDVSKKVRTVLLRLMHLRFKVEGKASNGGAGQRPGKPDGNPALQPYSEGERAIITAARLKAEKTPSVVEAKLNLDRAVTQRERNLASGGYREAMRKAMEEIDPRVKRIFARRDGVRPRPTDRVPPGERRRAPTKD